MFSITFPKRYFSPFPEQTLVFTCLSFKSVENTVGKGEIAQNEQFLLFPVFSTRYENLPPFSINSILSTVSVWTSLKFCHKGYTLSLFSVLLVTLFLTGYQNEILEQNTGFFYSI